MALACAKLMPLLCDIATCSAKRSRSNPSPANDLTVRIALRAPRTQPVDGGNWREACHQMRMPAHINPEHECHCCHDSTTLSTCFQVSADSHRAVRCSSAVHLKAWLATAVMRVCAAALSRSTALVCRLYSAAVIAVVSITPADVLTAGFGACPSLLTTQGNVLQNLTLVHDTAQASAHTCEDGSEPPGQHEQHHDRAGGFQECSWPTIPRHVAAPYGSRKSAALLRGGCSASGIGMSENSGSHRYGSHADADQCVELRTSS